MQVAKLEDRETVELFRQVFERELEARDPDFEGVPHTPVVESDQPKPPAEKADQGLEQGPSAPFGSFWRGFLLMDLHLHPPPAPFLPALRGHYRCVLTVGFHRPTFPGC